MSSVVATGFGKSSSGQAFLREWWPALVGLLVLYVPTYVSLAYGIWNSEDNAHGPIVLAVVLWMFWRKRDAYLVRGEDARPAWGASFLALGLLLYVVGRSQHVLGFEIGSQIFVLLGLLLFQGARAARRLWFALIFLAFMVPLPGFFVDAVTGPLKAHVSAAVEHLLYAAGYPVARNGVILTVGPYQLLVADACSGLNSMFSLSAMGLLYMYLVHHRSWFRNGLLAASIWPVAFGANVVRVVALALITYYFGDEAGQGFLHKFAGILLFVVSILFLFALDSLLGLLFVRNRGKTDARS